MTERLPTDELDPRLGARMDRCDVIIEVKRGEAASNPKVRSPGVLYAVFRRIGDVFEESADSVIDELDAPGSASTLSARVRLVAFGPSGAVDGGTVRSALRAIRHCVPVVIA